MQFEPCIGVCEYCVAKTHLNSQNPTCCRATCDPACLVTWNKVPVMQFEPCTPKTLRVVVLHAILLLWSLGIKYLIVLHKTHLTSQNPTFCRATCDPASLVTWDKVPVMQIVLHKTHLTSQNPTCCRATCDPACLVTWDDLPASREGTYKSKEQKAEKKEIRVLKYPNAAWSPVHVLSRQRMSRAQVTQETQSHITPPRMK
ncbi:hypothetical protein J6590_098880, partial [Homalodisca vitripennis]